MKRFTPWFVLCAALLVFGSAFATQSSAPEVVARRGKAIGGTGNEKPSVELTDPVGGWSAGMQLRVAGRCSDPTADPVEVNINGTRYFARSPQGQFSRKFPAAPGPNTVSVECRNAGGVGRATSTVDAVINPIPLKLVLTSDTDGAYTDLHIYEPDGTHVYWASTHSPSGGLFFLNDESSSFDAPGYGPYMFVHPAPPLGVFRVDTNYWPGGAVQHTLANLDVILNEGTPEEVRRRVRKPLAHPDETQTLAYIVIRGNRQPAQLFIPEQDADLQKPEAVKAFQRDVEPRLRAQTSDDSLAYLSPRDERSMRAAVVSLVLEQAQHPSPRWEPKQRDCAGLVRFAYREALRSRSTQQLNDLNVPPALFLPAVSDAARHLFPAYPQIWEIGATSSEQSRFGDFADAETLIGYNFLRVGGRPETGLPGDLLVFRKNLAADEPYHLMLLAEERGGRKIAAYHNGASGADAAVRVIALAELERPPDPVWIADEHNPHFLGVYRWKKFRPADLHAAMPSSSRLVSAPSPSRSS
jgi:uncharacterized protein YfaT (DUF1175 family)/uncharacterized protein YfaP (DUF2135 family)